MTSSDSRTLPYRGQSLADQVMNYVRHAVLTGEMKTGQLYSVHQLAELLGVSRSPVRQGLLNLEEAGLIEFSRNRGFRVVSTSPHDMAEIFSLRLAIEVPAAQRAARACTEELATGMDTLEARMQVASEDDAEELFFSLDHQLHELIMGAARSHRGREIVSRLRGATRMQGVSTAGKERTLQDILAEHTPVIEAIKSGQAEEAATAMRRHLTTTGQLLVAQAIDDQGMDLDADELWRDYTEDY
ncbi:GntR family transcriptional regulator [Paeniglutamicibacter antarcticus]|uniref:GntR family transcriptional regulator n=1 Tax=Paeniglutamicibacter antarcticus TaxID=494023 RepID=A0ABP9TTW3_9MICC